MDVIRLTRVEARRVAIDAQLLGADRPTSVPVAFQRLTGLQTDNGAGPAPNPDLLLWSRIGSSYDVTELASAFDEQRVVEIDGTLRPVEDVPLYLPEMRAWRDGVHRAGWQRQQRDWVAANAAARTDVLERLRRDGPLPASELPDSCTVAWRSSGWNNRRNLGRLLEFLARAGEVAVAGRDGPHRLWDLAERVYPDEPAISRADAARILDERRLRALGIVRATTAATPTEPRRAVTAGRPAVIDGVRGRWRVDPDRLDAVAGSFAGRTAILSPLDRLIFDRKRMTDLFEFDYQLEMYKPAARRRWGYFALPVLHDDRLIGKIDATADRAAGVLRVDAVHEDEPFDRSIQRGVRAELDDLARWLRLTLTIVD